MRLRFADDTLPAKIRSDERPTRRRAEPPQTYEAAAARVEEIIRRLDSGEASLNETLELVREGKALIELCARELAAVGDALEELRLDELVSRLEGEAGVSTWELLAELPVEIEDYALEPLQATVSSEFERKSTVIRLRGAGRRASARTSPTTPSTTTSCRPPVRPCRSPGASRSPPSAEHLAGLSLFPEPPQREVSARYRTWAYESAALDLALRQAHTTLHAALGASRSRCASSSRCASASRPSLEPVRRRLELYPGLRFKLDPTSSWDERADRRARAPPARSTRSTSRASTPARSSTSPPTRCSTGASSRPSRGLDRGSRAHPGDRRGARRPPRALLLGRADPLDRRHRGAALPAAHGQHQALAPGRAAQPARRL